MRNLSRRRLRALGEERQARRAARAVHATGSHRAPRRDTGFTLIEYSVSMGIFSVVIAITISGIVLMTRNTVKTTSLSTATDQIRQAFTRMDRQVRYADNINRPGLNAAGNRFYVEFQALDGTGALTCFQWRLDTTTRKLEYREWPASPAPASLTATFIPIASNISNTTTQPPFAFQQATSDQPAQGLDIMLIGRRPGQDTATVTLQTSLSARNSGVSSETNGDTNTDGNSDTPTCTTSGGALTRP